MNDLSTPFQTNHPDSNRTMMLIIYGLFVLGTLFGGLPTLIGLIIAYIKRSDMQGSIYASHTQFLIRTFWISVLGFILSIVLAVVGIGYLLMFVVGIWYLIRIIFGLIKAVDRKEVNPLTWWI